MRASKTAVAERHAAEGTTRAHVEFRRRVRSGERVVGTFTKLPTTASIDLAAAAGFDFVAIDLEHSELSFAETASLLSHALASDVPAVARVPGVDHDLINRLLEAGAAGIQLSFVQRVVQVDSLIAATRYAPRGRRSVSASHPSANFGELSLTEYLEREARDPPLIVGQIESAETDDTLEMIANAGLDVLFVGTTDLSVDLGSVGDLDSAPMRARIASVSAAAHGAGGRFGAFAGGTSFVDYLASIGATYLVTGSDVHALREGFVQLAADSRTTRRTSS